MLVVCQFTVKMSQTIYNAVFGSSSLTGRSPPASTSSDKRNLSDTSILDQEHSPVEHSAAKQPRIDGSPLSSSVINAEQPKDTQTMLEVMQARFNSLDLKLDSQQQVVLQKFDSILQRISLLEEGASSHQIVVDNLEVRVEELEKSNSELAASKTELENRVRALEAQDTRDSSNALVGWEPSGSSKTRVVLMGDSNSSGKLKFGENRGTLGKALPGESIFCPTLTELKEPESNTFVEATDVIVAVGTNDLKQDNVNPSSLAKKLSKYVLSVIAKYPSVQVFLPGVLPICTENSQINSRVREYNHYIRDLCISHPRLTFIDTNVFSTPLGSLKPNLAAGPSDPLHLYAEGIKLYGSRFKFALRQRHGLPVGNRRRSAPTVKGRVTNSLGPSSRGGRGGQRGGSQLRGGH